ncbi:FAD-dependent oxidoreductase [Rhodococcus opacus]|nr:FAD-dependent oxidoreductase [Rhodococcus opacus]
MTIDVAVVGLGAFGSAALWRLAARGVDVVGIEQFGVAHALGSSHGSTRLFRTACLEHPGLVPLARHAATLWDELERESGTPILRRTGAVLIGPESGRAVGGTRRQRLPTGWRWRNCRSNRSATGSRNTHTFPITTSDCGTPRPASSGPKRRSPNHCDWRRRTAPTSGPVPAYS